jgi:predicted nuclease with TOPRIM domain
MTELAELDERVNRLTLEVVDIRGIATKAEIDAADVRAGLRGHTKALEALRKTQLEQGRDIVDLRSEMRRGFARIDERFARIDERFARIDERFAGIDGRLDGMDKRFDGMDERFARLEGEMKEGFATVGVELAKISTLLRVAIKQPGQPVES